MAMKKWYSCLPIVIGHGPYCLLLFNYLHTHINLMIGFARALISKADELLTV